jgi:hypothetical protein
MEQEGERVKWERIAPRRVLRATPVDCRWNAPRTMAGSLDRRPRASHVPLVIREPEAGLLETAAPTVTVAAVREIDARQRIGVLVSRLAALAVDDELLVVFGSGARPRHQYMIDELRGRLPRHDVVAMHVRHRHDRLLRDAATVERLLELGSLPVVVTPTATMHAVTAEIASYLRADRVLRTTTGADLYQVWQRHPEPSVN